MCHWCNSIVGFREELNLGCFKFSLVSISIIEGVFRAGEMSKEGGRMCWKPEKEQTAPGEKLRASENNC